MTILLLQNWRYKRKNYRKLLLNKANFLAISPGYIWNNNKYKPYEAIRKIKMKINATEIRVGDDIRT